MEPNDIKIRILLAARKLFAKQGFEGTTVRQICEEAGGNVALVSYHFGGKENVFFAILDTFFPGTRIHEFEDQFKDPVNGIRFIINGVLRFKIDDPELAMILDREVTLQTPRVERIKGYTFPVWLKLRDMLEEGRNQGIFDFRSLDHALLFVIGSILNSGCNPIVDSLMLGGERNIELLIEDNVTFVLKGLGYQSDKDQKEKK